MGENPLHVACAGGDASMVDAFLHHSAESLHAFTVDVRVCCCWYGCCCLVWLLLFVWLLLVDRHPHNMSSLCSCMVGRR